MPRSLVALIAVVATVVVIVVVAAALVFSGLPSVAAFPVGSSWLDGLMGHGSKASIQRHARSPSPPPPANALMLGAAHYTEMCESCHGAPGVEPSEVGQGLNPRAPHLDKVARQWTDPQLFWIVKHGIRMTGMPGFGKTHPDSMVSAIVYFVRRLPTMSASEYRRLADSAKTMHME